MVGKALRDLMNRLNGGTTFSAESDEVMYTVPRSVTTTSDVGRLGSKLGHSHGP